MSNDRVDLAGDPPIASTEVLDAIAELFRAARRRHLRHTSPLPKGDVHRAAQSEDDAIAARTIDELVADFAKMFRKLDPDFDPDGFKGECALPAARAK